MNNLEQLFSPDLNKLFDLNDLNSGYFLYNKKINLMPPLFLKYIKLKA